MRVLVLLVLGFGCYRAGTLPSAGDATGDGSTPDDAPPPDLPMDLLQFCPPSFETVGGGMYLAVEVAGFARSWDEAEALCESHQSTVTGPVHTHLVVITSEQEHSAVGVLTTVPPWIGYTDRANEGTWASITGESSSYLGNGPGTTPPSNPWSDGQPDNGGGGSNPENCAILSTGPGRPLDDRPCENAVTISALICECDTFAVQ